MLCCFENRIGTRYRTIHSAQRTHSSNETHQSRPDFSGWETSLIKSEWGAASREFYWCTNTDCPTFCCSSSEPPFSNCNVSSLHISVNHCIIGVVFPAAHQAWGWAKPRRRWHRGLETTADRGIELKPNQTRPLIQSNWSTDLCWYSARFWVDKTASSRSGPSKTPWAIGGGPTLNRPNILTSHPTSPSQRSTKSCF